MQKVILMPRLKLIAADVALLQAATEGNEALAKMLDATVPDNWTEFGVGAMHYALEQLLRDTSGANWWAYFPVHLNDNLLVGSGGYKGSPTPEGIIELGYEIAPDYRNQGLATEMARGLTDNAFTYSHIHCVMAHTLAEENASARVLRKCGFNQIAALEDPDDGPIWQWARYRSDH